MTTITEVAQTLQVVLTETARIAGQASGFVQRASKMDGAGMTQTLVFGFLANPQATWEELSQTAATLGLDISAQGLDERLTAKAAECLRQVLQAAVAQVVRSETGPTLPIWERFAGVYVQDSSTISLPAALVNVWQGCGGGQQAGDGAAALKVQVQWELISGQLSALVLQDGRAADRSAGYLLEGLPAGAVCLTDLGYFSLVRLDQQATQGVYWLTRLQAGKCVELEGHCGRLSDWLPAQSGPTGEWAVSLGRQLGLACRLLARRVSPSLAASRRRKLHTEARRQGQTVSAERLALADWEVLVTNVPADQLAVDEAWELARVRWQIELLFKLWKSHGQIDAWRSAKPWRILCEIYAKLIGQIVQHWLLLLSCWARPDRSLRKAAQTIRKQAFHLASHLHTLPDLIGVLECLHTALQRVGRLNKRKSHPSTYQILAALPAKPALA